MREVIGLSHRMQERRKGAANYALCVLWLPGEVESEITGKGEYGRCSMTSKHFQFICSFIQSLFTEHKNLCKEQRICKKVFLSNRVRIVFFCVVFCFFFK